MLNELPKNSRVLLFFCDIFFHNVSVELFSIAKGKIRLKILPKNPAHAI